MEAKRIISVGGGKGGVGKSLLAANLALAMAQSGARVIIVDADLGAANQHILFGIDKPGPTLQGLFEHTIDSLDEALVSTCERRLGLIPGSSAVVGAANINHAQKVKLMRHIRALKADAVVIDVGAGVSFNVLDLFDLADLRLVVITPQLTSLQNAYAFLKSAVFREIKRLADNDQRKELVDDSPEASVSNRRIPDLVARIRERDAGFAQLILGALANFGARVIGNNVFDPAERNILLAISRMTSDFLGIDTPVLGYLRSSRRIHDSVGYRRPYLLDTHTEESARAIREIARYLLAADIGVMRHARQSIEAHEASMEQPGEEPLPAALVDYQRSHDRVAVSCQATLIISAKTITVEIADISEKGARLNIDRSVPSVGERAVLILGCLPDKPSMMCIVRHYSAEGRYAGVEFIGDKTFCQRIANELIRRFASVDLMPPS